MSFTIIEIIITVVAGGVGTGAGFLLRGWALATSTAAAALKADEAEADKDKIDPEKARAALAHLHDLTHQVAADVGAHSRSVQEINDQLNDGQQSGEAVTAAMRKLLRANAAMQEQLETAEQRLYEQARKMELYKEQARTDALTGIANRRAFDEFIARQESEFNRHARPATVLMLDVDHFKKFNDTYGHAAGDEVLQGVAQVLEDSMRDIDLVARYGGEEFTVVFPGTKIHEANPAAERARAAIERTVFRHEGSELKVTASFGLAEIRSGETMVQTTKRADDALYASKKTGRNNARWHDGETSHRVAAKYDAPVVERKTETVKGVVDGVADVATDVAEPLAATDLGVDEETQLSNRQAFVEDVRRRFSHWRRNQDPMSLIMIGIDDLPALTQRFGKTGQHVAMKAATQFLKAAMREMDHVARFDEDTFALLLPTATLTSSEAIAERLRLAIAKCALPLASEQLRFTISLGVAEARSSDDADKLVARSVAALDEARNDGENRTYVHTGAKIELTKQVVVV